MYEAVFLSTKWCFKYQPCSSLPSRTFISRIWMNPVALTFIKIGLYISSDLQSITLFAIKIMLNWLSLPPQFHIDFHSKQFINKGLYSSCRLKSFIIHESDVLVYRSIVDSIKYKLLLLKVLNKTWNIRFDILTNTRFLHWIELFPYL